MACAKVLHSSCLQRTDLFADVLANAKIHRELHSSVLSTTREHIKSTRVAKTTESKFYQGDLCQFRKRSDNLWIYGRIASTDEININSVERWVALYIKRPSIGSKIEAIVHVALCILEGIPDHSIPTQGDTFLKDLLDFIPDEDS